MFRCFRNVKYLMTTRSQKRSTMMKSAWLQLQKKVENENYDSFYQNVIEKYFEKFVDEKFENLSYFEYFANYKFDFSKNDSLIVEKKQFFKRKKSILLRVTHKRFCNENVFFYDRLLYQHHWRNENEIREIDSNEEIFANYKNHFITKWFDEYLSLQKYHVNETKIIQINVDIAFTKTNDKIASLKSNNQNQIIREKLQHMRINIKMSSMQSTVLNFENDQLITYNYIITQFIFQIESRSRSTFFFVTKFEEIDKSFLFFALKTWLINHKWFYAKTISTKIATNHIDEKTIHNTFEIAQKNDDFSNSYKSCVIQKKKMYDRIKKYRVLIIDEIFMINDEFFNFINELLTRVHNNNNSFENIHVIVFENFMQFSFVTKRQIFHVFQWKQFTFMFLTKSRRHDRNSAFDKLLEIVRMNKITNDIMNTLHKRYHEFDIRNLTNRCTIFMFLKININKFNDLMLKKCCIDESYEHKTMNKKKFNFEDI